MAGQIAVALIIGHYEYDARELRLGGTDRSRDDALGFMLVPLMRASQSVVIRSVFEAGLVTEGPVPVGMPAFVILEGLVFGY